MTGSRRRELTRRIETVLKARAPELAAQLAQVLDVRVLPYVVRESIVDVLSDEFSEKGLTADGQLNDYGVEIDEMTTACEPWRPDVPE